MYGLQSLRNYFNDGVLLINVQQYNDRFNVDQIFCPYQKYLGILVIKLCWNIMFGNETKLLPYRWQLPTYVKSISVIRTFGILI